MTDSVSGGTTFGGQRSYLGQPMRGVLIALVSALAGTFELFLLRTVRSAPALLPWTILNYLLPIFHALPWLAGLSCWTRVGRALNRGVITPSGADLCYGVIIALLSTAYGVMGYLELLLMLPRLLNH